jgi:hypothetical protein
VFTCRFSRALVMVWNFEAKSNTLNVFLTVQKQILWQYWLHCVDISMSLWLYSPCGTWPLFQFINLHAVGKTPWTGDQPVARPLLRTIQTQNKRTQTSMARVGFEPTIAAFKRAKTVDGTEKKDCQKIRYTANCFELQYNRKFSLKVFVFW